MEALENKPRNRESRRDTGRKKVLWSSLGGFSFPGRSKTEKVAVRFSLIPWNKKTRARSFTFFPPDRGNKKSDFPFVVVAAAEEEEEEAVFIGTLQGKEGLVFGAMVSRVWQW